MAHKNFHTKPCMFTTPLRTYVCQGFVKKKRKESFYTFSMIYNVLSMGHLKTQEFS